MRGAIGVKFFDFLTIDRAKELMEKVTIIQRLSGDEFTGEVVHGNCIRCKADIHGEPHLKLGSIKVHSTTVVKWAYFCHDCGSEIQALIKSRSAVNNA